MTLLLLAESLFFPCRALVGQEFNRNSSRRVFRDKVAIAACGCHDNRMDKASCNEQWMGYPVGQHYSYSSNIDNAHRLAGKLLLIVGEMDTNVPPESTMRFADALIRGNKDFDLVVVPNAGHGMGNAYGQRKMHDFLVRHLRAEE